MKQNEYKIFIQNTGHKICFETPGSRCQGNTEINLKETHSETVDRIHEPGTSGEALVNTEVKQGDFFTPRADKSDGMVHRVSCAHLANVLPTENCVLLGYYAASSGNSLPKFRDKLSVPSSKAKNKKNWTR